MSDAAHKATVVIGDKTVTFEGPRDFVESQVAKYTGLCSYTQAESNNGTDIATGAVFAERDLVRTKQPKGHPETVAVLAFALAQNGKEDFTEDDIKKAYIRAGVRPPKVVGQAIRDAKNVSDFVEPTGKRGVYRLTTHGDRTVRFDLPRSKK